MPAPRVPESDWRDVVVPESGVGSGAEVSAAWWGRVGVAVAATGVVETEGVGTEGADAETVDAEAVEAEGIAVEAVEMGGAEAALVEIA